MADHNHFVEFWRVLDACKVVQSRNILMSMGKCATHLQDMPFYGMLGYYSPNFTSMMPSKRTRYDQILRRMSPSVLTYLLTMSLPNMPFPAAISCIMFVKATAASGRRERQTWSLTRDVFVAYETIKSFLYARSIDWLHKEKILNLELTMFHLKCKVSNKCHKFFGKSYFQAAVNINFICLYFCGSNSKM